MLDKSTMTNCDSENCKVKTVISFLGKLDICKLTSFEKWDILWFIVWKFWGTDLPALGNRQGRVTEHRLKKFSRTLIADAS